MPASSLADRLARTSHLEVRIGSAVVGRLAQPSRRGPVLFEYDSAWLASGYSLNPLSLPLKPGVQVPPRTEPGALFGVFSDSLPDDWGRLLVERKLVQLGADPFSVTTLARLALVGSEGMGALEYDPGIDVGACSAPLGSDELFEQCRQLLETDSAAALDTLYRGGGSSGGARPKVMLDLDGEPWIVKFPASSDGLASGLDEFRFAAAARRCGIDMPDVRLMPSNLCEGFFAVKRFDRVCAPDGSPRKIHMASAAALLEADPFDETIDYRDLMRLSSVLTHDVRNAEQLFRVMCFNVLAGNCDDHVRNFSFLCDECGEWRLSPAYDLTFNPGFFGEHSVLVNGKGKGIGESDLAAVGAVGGVSAGRAREVIEQVKAVVAEDLQDILRREG